MSLLTLRTFHIFDASASNVWDLLADFGAIQSWWPTEGPVVIERVELEGQGLGMVRHVYNRGAAHPVSERLDRLDSAERVLQLSILGRPPARTPWYQATARLVELEDGRCRLEYQSEFSAPRGRENQTRDGILVAYRALFSGLQTASAAAPSGTPPTP
jgi:uncharacterized protein YndB with AHSA1/START domain